MIKKINASVILAVLGLLSTQSALAFTTTVNLDSSIFTEVAGAVTQDFNSSLSLPSGYVGGAIFNLPNTGSHAQPPGDPTNYYSVGGGASDSSGNSGSVSYGFLASYFGFYGGSPDTYNSIAFYNGDTLVQDFNGTQIAAIGPVNPNGDRNVGKYYNFFADSSDQYFNKVVFSSTSAAFETDNHAVLAAPVPEPETYAMMMAGLGVMGAVARRRKQKQA